MKEQLGNLAKTFGEIQDEESVGSIESFVEEECQEATGGDPVGLDSPVWPYFVSTDWATEQPAIPIDWRHNNVIGM